MRNGSVFYLGVWYLMHQRWKFFLLKGKTYPIQFLYNVIFKVSHVFLEYPYSLKNNTQDFHNILII